MDTEVLEKEYERFFKITAFLKYLLENKYCCENLKLKSIEIEKDDKDYSNLCDKKYFTFKLNKETFYFTINSNVYQYLLKKSNNIYTVMCLDITSQSNYEMIQCYLFKNVIELTLDKIFHQRKKSDVIISANINQSNLGPYSNFPDRCFNVGIRYESKNSLSNLPVINPEDVINFYFNVNSFGIFDIKKCTSDRNHNRKTEYINDNLFFLNTSGLNTYENNKKNQNYIHKETYEKYDKYDKVLDQIFNENKDENDITLLILLKKILYKNNSILDKEQ